MKRQWGIALFVSALVLSGCSMQKSGVKPEIAGTGQKSAVMESRPQEAGQQQLPLKVDYLTPLSSIKTPEIYVYKEKRRLYIIQSDVLVRDYPIGLGFHPQGDKEREGDGRTPEGDFFVCVKNATSRFVKSLGLNYPEKRHAERAFFAGALSPNEFRDILLAHEKKSAPPWGTILGGEIFIHAGGAHKDWTDGCVALYNSDMDELFRIASLGTTVVIRP
jgi:murein L,D-transpeptidase YafK